jgi:hypothetical protein
MKIRFTDDSGNSLTMEQDLEGNLVIQHQTPTNEVTQFLVEVDQRSKLAQLVEAL